MNMSRAIPEETDPAHELERQLAVIYVRLNIWRHPLTGTPMSQEERDWITKRRTIFTAQELASDGANQRVWMNREWIDKTLPTSALGESEATKHDAITKAES